MQAGITRVAALERHSTTFVSGASTKVTFTSDPSWVISESASTGGFIRVTHKLEARQGSTVTYEVTGEPQPSGDFLVNAQGTAFLAETARRAGAPIVHVSSDYVFDGSADRPYCENDPTGPPPEQKKGDKKG